MDETPFRVEVLTVTGLTVSSVFPLSLARTAAMGYLQDEPTLPLASNDDRIGLRTIVVRLFGEILSETKRIELLDDDGVAWLIPADRVLAVRIIDPERTPGPPRGLEVRHIGFQLRRPTPAGTPTVPDGPSVAPAAPLPDGPTVAPAPPLPDTAAGEVGIRPSGEVD